METEYKIVWVDDSPEWVESVQEQIEQHVVSHGLTPIIELLRDGSKLDDKLSEDVSLLIVDYKLKGDNGDLLIQRVREQKVFTEVVLYSYYFEPSTQITPLEGIYFCKREHAIERICSVVDQTLHKLRDLSVIRGMVITAAIDIENLVEDVLELFFKESGGLFRSRIIEKRFLDCGKKVELLNGALKDHLKSCDESDRVFLDPIKRQLVSIQEQVFEKRNVLAHARKTILDGQVILKSVNKKGDQTIDEAWLRETRTSIASHRESLKQLISRLGARVAK